MSAGTELDKLRKNLLQRVDPQEINHIILKDINNGCSGSIQQMDYSARSSQAPDGERSGPEEWDDIDGVESTIHLHVSGAGLTTCALV